MQIVMAMQDHPDRPPMLSFTVSNQEAERIKRWRKAKPGLDLIVEIAVLVCEGDEARRQNRTVAEDLLWSTSRYCSSRGCGCDNRHARAPAARQSARHRVDPGSRAPEQGGSASGPPWHGTGRVPRPNTVDPSRRSAARREHRARVGPKRR